MFTFLLILHTIVTVALIVVVLFQTDKGQGLSGAFGGGASQAMFGSSPETTGITKLTTGVAIVFMVTSLGLAIMSKNNKTEVSAANFQTPPPAAAQQTPADTTK